MGIRYSIDLDKELHKAYKLKALEKDVSMRKLVIKALEEFLIKDKDENICFKRDCPVTVEHLHITGISEGGRTKQTSERS